MIIDQLPLLGGDVQGTDEFPIERGTTTYKTTQAALIKAATDAAAAAQAAADDAQLAADNAQDTADEANAKGLPSGGTAGQVLTKADSSDYSAAWQNPSGGGDVTADVLGIVIDGNSTPVGASEGQYVIVKDSTISGITDGLYTAAQAIPENTAIDATYLAAVGEGGLNDLHSILSDYVLVKRFSKSVNSTSRNPVTVNLSTPTGYKPVAILYAQTSGFLANTMADVPTAVNSNFASVDVYQLGTGWGTGSVFVYVLYIKDI